MGNLYSYTKPQSIDSVVKSFEESSVLSISKLERGDIKVNIIQPVADPIASPQDTEPEVSSAMVSQPANIPLDQNNVEKFIDALSQSQRLPSFRDDLSVVVDKYLPGIDTNTLIVAIQQLIDNFTHQDDGKEKTNAQKG